MLVSWDRTIRPSVPAGVSGSAAPEQIGGVRCLGSQGFIANRAELTRRLGLPQDASDRQVLVHLHHRAPLEAPQQISGPFSWILWDEPRHELVAVRDRTGTQGLYYAVRGETVVVASRLERLLERLTGPVAFNPRSIVAQIHWQPPPAGETCYEGIQTVEPGSALTIAPDRVSVLKYWQIEPQTILKLASDAEYADAFREVLFRVVREYVPTGPVAVALSGGLDSATLAAAIRTVSPATPVTAVTLVAPELPESDEGPRAASTAKHLGLPSVGLRADVHWPLSSAGGIHTSPDTPFYSLFTDVWRVGHRQLTERGIPVMFTGVSGDHLFDYVSAYPDLLLTGRWMELARQLRTHLPHANRSLAHLVRTTVLSPLARAHGPRWLTTAKTPVPWLAAAHRAWYIEHFGRSDRTWRRLPGSHHRLVNLQDRTLPHGNQQANRQAADAQVERRHPLLDHRLIEFALSVPVGQTYRAGLRKLIMRDAMRGYLPDALLDRRDNIFTGAIVRRGLKEREQTKVWSLITNMRAAALGFVDEACLQQTYRAYLAGEVRHESFWHTLTLEDWLRRYFP